jgi:hypothetical protein
LSNVGTGSLYSQIQITLLRLGARAIAVLCAHSSTADLLRPVDGSWLRSHTRAGLSRSGITVIIGHVGKAAIKLELEFALATAHAAPAVKENAGDHHNADNNQPLAQTDIP